MAEELSREGRNDRTATPDPLKLVVYVIVAAIAIALGLVFGNWLTVRIYTSHKSETPLKGAVVVTRQGDIVDATEPGLAGQNLILMLPANQADEARWKMERRQPLTLDLPMGMVQMAATSEGRWVGVVK